MIAKRRTIAAVKRVFLIVALLAGAGVAGARPELAPLPMAVEGVTEKLGCSIGISIYPDDAGDAEQLIAHADHAMYAAKAGKRGRYTFFAA